MLSIINDFHAILRFMYFGFAQQPVKFLFLRYNAKYY